MDWKDRGSSLFRLKGMPAQLHFLKGLSASEQIKIDAASKIIKDVLDHFDEESEKLGFDIVPKCWCGKQIVWGTSYCEKHYTDASPLLKVKITTKSGITKYVKTTPEGVDLLKSKYKNVITQSL